MKQNMTATQNQKLYGAIEAGGTKFVCAIGDIHGDIKESIKIPTTTPEETLSQSLDFFRKYKNIEALGIGSFGPIDLNKNSKTYGYITSTPKKGWQNVNFVGYFQKSLNIPVGFDTDVNAAALGEYKWGAGQNLKSIVYLTIGTGIGGGVLIEGKPIHGILHPEIGHICVPKFTGDSFDGVCPFHENKCLEGLISGPAIMKRWGLQSDQFPEGHAAWEVISYYLASGLMSIILTISPEKIILGGGVMSNLKLFPLIRNKIKSMLNNYLQIPEILENINDYIVPPGLQSDSGIKGSLALGISQ